MLLTAGCRAAAGMPQLPCLQQNVRDGGPKACEINHAPSCSRCEADAPAIKEHASQKMLCQAGTWAHAELKGGKQAQNQRAVPLWVCKPIRLQPGTAALTHRLHSCLAGMRQLVSLGLGRSRAGPCAASRPPFLGLPPSKSLLAAARWWWLPWGLGLCLAMGS